MIILNKKSEFVKILIGKISNFIKKAVFYNRWPPQESKTSPRLQKDLNEKHYSISMEGLTLPPKSLLVGFDSAGAPD